MHVNPEVERQRQINPWSSLASKFNQTSEPKVPMKDPSSKNKVDGD